MRRFFFAERHGRWARYAVGPFNIVIHRVGFRRRKWYEPFGLDREMVEIYWESGWNVNWEVIE